MTLYYRCGRCHQVSLTWPVNTSAPWMRWCPRCTLPSSTHSSTRCTRTAPGQPNTPTITQWPIICPIYLINNLKDNFSKDNVVIFFQWMHTGILHVCCSLKKKEHLHWTYTSSDFTFLIMYVFFVSLEMKLRDYLGSLTEVFLTVLLLNASDLHCPV